MTNPRNTDFGKEMALVLPALLREVNRRHETIFLEDNLALPQIVVLDLLRERGPCNMSDLARTLNHTMSATTGIIDKMIRMEMVKRERSQEDRRVVIVALLRKGEEAAKRVNEARRDLSNEMYSVFTQKEKQEYLRLLKKVYDNLREKQ